VPAIDELTFFFAMLIPFNRVMRNPTLTQEIKDKDLGDKYPFGFPLYAVGQCADILAFRPQLVPVGEDQLPHLELTREVARKFDQLYCGVHPQTEDKDYLAKGGLFPVIEPKLGRVKRLVGLGPPNADGTALEDEQVAEQRDLPERRRRRGEEEDHGDVHRPQADHRQGAGRDRPGQEPAVGVPGDVQSRYGVGGRAPGAVRRGKIGDVVVKRKLIEALDVLLAPIRERRRHFEQRPDDVMDALRHGTRRANAVAEETLALAKQKMRQDFFPRGLTIG
jgi:tryptophanyl-tRNA synthetase